MKDITYWVCSHSKADSYCLIKNKFVVVVVTDYTKNVIIIGPKFDSYASLYYYPLNSNVINIFNMRKMTNELGECSVSDIINKCRPSITI